MTAAGEFDGVLISGVYGTGKSSVAVEIAETLERRGVSYGALDLDWLTWFDVPGMDAGAARRVYLANVAAVVRHYRDFGVRHVVLAGAVRDKDEVRALETAAAIPLRVVRLEVTLDEIARRLRPDPAADPTTSRSPLYGSPIRSVSASRIFRSSTPARFRASPARSSTGSTGSPERLWPGSYRKGPSTIASAGLPANSGSGRRDYRTRISDISLASFGARRATREHLTGAAKLLSARSRRAPGSVALSRTRAIVNGRCAAFGCGVLVTTVADHIFRGFETDEARA